MLILSAFYAIQLVCELMFGEINNATIPEGAPDNILLITKIVLASIAGLLLIPNIYIGVKGLKVAKNPDSSKAHIVWAIILLVFSCLALISPIVDFINNGIQYKITSAFCSIVVDITVFIEYIYYARAVAKGA